MSILKNKKDIKKNMLTCPHCREGKVKFNIFWFIDTDAYLYCDKCRARLAHINFLTVAILWAIGATILYAIYQNWGADHSIASAKRLIKFLIPVFFILISAIRLGLLWGLWVIKNPPSGIFSKESTAEEPWWQPFVEEEPMEEK